VYGVGGRGRAAVKVYGCGDFVEGVVELVLEEVELRVCWGVRVLEGLVFGKVVCFSVTD
jgi:hypothetical protein